MRFRLLTEDPHRQFILVFETGDEVAATLKEFAMDNQLQSAEFRGIGAAERITLGYFSWTHKKYLKRSIDEQVEIVSLIGNITRDNGQARIHAHCVITTSEYQAFGGHLLEARIRPTLELTLTDTKAKLERSLDPESKLKLIKAA